jgi:ferredoxin
VPRVAPYSSQRHPSSFLRTEFILSLSNEALCICLPARRRFGEGRGIFEQSEKNDLFSKRLDSMVLENLLLQNKTTILKRWFDLILETYPADAVTLMRKEQNQFKNPVGATFSREIETLFKQLCEGGQNGECQTSLDAILKIRSVQDFSPSKAVGFIFQLKKAIEETLKSEICREQNIEAWRAFQSRIDALALQAFDVYMGCREKICEIRVNQAKAEREMALRMMERMNPSKEKKEED